MADKAEAAKAAAQPAPVVFVSAADEARAREVEAIRRKQAAEDARRAAAPRARMVAHVGFTLITDEAPEGEVIRPGQTFELSAYDVPAFLGRARLVEETGDAEDRRGASVTPA